MPFGAEHTTPPFKRVASSPKHVAAGPSKYGRVYGDVLGGALDDETLAGPPTSRPARSSSVCAARRLPHPLLLLLLLLCHARLATAAFHCDGNYKYPFQCSGGGTLRKSVSGVTGKTQATCTTYCEGQASPLSSSSSSFSAQQKSTAETSGCCYFKPKDGVCKFFPGQTYSSAGSNRYASICTKVTNCVSGSTYNTGNGQTPCSACSTCAHGVKTACAPTTNTVCHAASCSSGSTYNTGTGREPCT